MSERWDLCSPIEQHPYPRERLWSDCEDELSEVKQMLADTRERNYKLSEENFQLRLTLRLANEQVSDLIKKFDELKKGMGYG